MNTAGEHQIRPGLTMRWGGGGFDPPRAGADIPTAFVFSLVDASTDSRVSSMALIAEGGVANDPREPTEPAFHVALVVSAGALDELLAEDKTPGATRVRRIAGGQGEARLTLPLSPGARLAVESVRRCPFAGAIRTMALAARCNDLLFEFFTGLAAAGEPRRAPVTRSVNNQIHAAAEELKRRLESPPTLAALAHGAGMSETTLKRGFRQVFGATVFGYLRERRMERAQSLLASGEATVLEAATRVGYSNPSNFSVAFRQQFGVNPKAFQMAARR